ncbi:MAG: hypothetical protein DRN00_01705 [Thermoplasmata archaeon]|nr:MAG: hypothetical protein DRN00_01705 [Thermoplasmata archaeon]
MLKSIVKRIELILPVIGIIVLFYLLKSIGIEDIANAMSEVDPSMFAISALMVFIRKPIGAYKWYLLTRFQDFDIPYSKILKFYFMGYFYAVVTPGGVGNYIRAKFLYDEEGRIGKAVTNVAIDAFIDMACLYFLGLIGTLILFPHYFTIMLILLFLFTITSASLLIILNKKASHAVARTLLKFAIPYRYRDRVKVEKLFEELPPKRALPPVLALSMLTWILYLLQICPIVAGLSIKMPFLDAFFLWAISCSISFLPITISGVGIREWLVMILANKYNVTNVDSLALSLLGYIAISIFPALIGAVLSMHHHLKRSLP